MELEHSRALRLGAGVTGLAPENLDSRLSSSSVVVSLEPGLPGADLCGRVLLTTLRRLPGEIVLRTRGVPTSLVDSLVGAVGEVDSARPLRLDAADREEGACRVHVGLLTARPAIRVVPDGYGASVASDLSIRLDPARDVHPLGAIFGAALGAGEVFKVIAGVIESRGRPHRIMRFCPVSLSADPARPTTPQPRDEVSLAIVGVGAVGTGIALILAECGYRGQALLIDPQDFAAENVGTYSLGGRQDAARAVPKVELAQRALRNFRCTPFKRRVEEAIEEIDTGRLTWPDLVLTALDDRTARHQAQRLWPDRLIDAGTGDTMLGILDVEYAGGPCMMCHLPPGAGEDSIKRLSEATGLPEQRLTQGAEQLGEEDLRHVAPEKREKLRPHLGKPICGLAEAFGLTALPSDGYRPAVPFVSLQAACLAVGRMIAPSIGFTGLPNRVQYDALVGPLRGTYESQAQVATCYCCERTPTIAEIRRRRLALRAGVRADSPSTGQSG